MTKREKEQPENRIHSVPDAMRKNRGPHKIYFVGYEYRRFVLMRQSGA